MHYLFYMSLLMLTVPSVAAQPQQCDNILQYGDTTICQDFTGKKHRLFREHFYVDGERIFTRWWNYHKDGTYYWQQKRKKGAFAKAEGPAMYYYADGSIYGTARFSKGKQVGDCLEYYPSGAIKLRCHHAESGKPDGIRTIYHENGQVQAKVRLENGLLREVLEYKNEEGQDLPVGSFQQGNGDWIWYEKGQPTYRYTYQDGREKKKQKIDDGNFSE